MELEADSRGITEILEKKSLELDLPATNSFSNSHSTTGSMTTAMMPEIGSSPVGVGDRSVPPPPLDRGSDFRFSSCHSTVEVAGAPQYMQIIGGGAVFLR